MRSYNKFFISIIPLIVGLVMMYSYQHYSDKKQLIKQEHSLISLNFNSNSYPSGYICNIKVCDFKESVNLYLEFLPIGRSDFVLEGHSYYIHKWNNDYFSFYTNLPTNKKETISAIDKERNYLLKNKL